MDFEIREIMTLPERKVYKVGDQYGRYGTSRIKGIRIEEKNGEPKVILQIGDVTSINWEEITLT